MSAHDGIMDGKVVLATGEIGGIGKATTEGLANLGASIVVVGRDRSKGVATAAEIHRLAREFEANHERLDALALLIANLWQRSGSPHFLVRSPMS